MAYFGWIKSYDSGKGSGMIAPETGGDSLPFQQSDLKHGSEHPKIDQRYRYEISEVSGGLKRAISMQQQQGAHQTHDEQARSQNA